MRKIDKACDKAPDKVIRIYLSCIIMTTVLILLASGCKEHHIPSSTKASWQWPAMGTVASLTVYGGEADTALMLAKAAVEEVNTQLSAFDPASDVGKINAAAGTGAYIALRPQTRQVLDASILYYRESGGAFNPLVGPLMEAWGFSRGGEKSVVGVPSADTREAAQRLCDFSRLDRSADGGVRLLDPGMKLDFGAIAKGYAVDLAFEHLLGAGYTNVLMNLGGNMRAIGVPSPVRKGWRIAVRDPRKALTDQPLGTVLLVDGCAIATSGNYEQYFEWEGKRYSHIMDPRIGYPVGGVLQVTIIAPTAMMADALSTTCFVLGVEEGLKYLARYPQCEALFVLDDAKKGVLIKMSVGFRDMFERGKVESDEQ